MKENKTKENKSKENKIKKTPKLNISIKQENLVKILKVLVVVFAVLALLFFAANKFGDVTFSSVGDYFNGLFSGVKKGEGYPYYFENSAPKDIKKINSDMLVIGDESYYVLDSTARKLNLVSHSFSQPIADSNNGRAIVFDVGSTNYSIISKTKVFFEGKTKQKILVGCVGNDGSYAVATRGETSTSQLMVFNSTHKEIFKWDCSKENIVAIDISDNGKRAAVSVVGAENGELYSKVIIFDFDYKEPLNEMNFGSQIVSKIDFINGYKFIASGENVLCIIDRSFKKEEIDLSLNTLSRIYTGENNMTAAVLSKYGSSSAKILKVYNKNGDELFSTELNFAVRSVSCDGNYISVLADNQLLSYNKRGKVVGNSEITSDGVSCFTDGNRTYVLTTSSIDCYKTFGEHKLNSSFVADEDKN